MHVGRDYPVAAFLGGKLYVAGGWDTDGDATASMEVYDPATDNWSDGPDLPTAVAAASAAVLDNRIYVIGGCTTDACGTAAVQVYDPSRWEPAAGYPSPVAFEGCGTIAGTLYCAGGTSDQTGDSRDGYAYHPATDQWTQIAGLPHGDQWAAASGAAGGRLLLVGGVIHHSGLITNQGWAYDPTSDTWAPLPNANTVSWRSAGACGFYKVGGSSLAPAVVNAEVLPGFGDCGAGVSWLSFTPGGARTLAPGETMTVTATLDASGLDQPSSYTGALTLSEDTPYPFATVPVSMTVEPPQHWGKLAGTVTGTSCAGNTVALPGATVTVAGRRQTFTLTTGVDGRYQLWLDRRNSPLDITVGKDGWAPGGRTGIRLSNATTTVDVALTPAPAC